MYKWKDVKYFYDTYKTFLATIIIITFACKKWINDFGTRFLVKRTMYNMVLNMPPLRCRTPTIFHFHEGSQKVITIISINMPIIKNTHATQAVILRLGIKNSVSACMTRFKKVNWIYLLWCSTIHNKAHIAIKYYIVSAKRVVW